MSTSKTIIFYRAHGARKFKQSGSATTNGSLYLVNRMRDVLARSGGTVAIVDIPAENSGKGYADFARAMIKAVILKWQGKRDTGHNFKLPVRLQRKAGAQFEIFDPITYRKLTGSPAVILIGDTAARAWFDVDQRSAAHDLEVAQKGRASWRASRAV